MNKSFILSALVSLTLIGCAVQPPQQGKENVADNALSQGNPLPMDLSVTQVAKIDLNNSSHLKPMSLEKRRKINTDIYMSDYQEYPEVVRYDRYTLVSSSPVGGQKYLLEQLVQVNMLGKKKAYTLSVEQGIWNTLKNTGYTLCNVMSPDVRSLLNHQLPKVHYQFGPMKLREALQMLSGEAYELTVNDTQREVCFERRAIVSPVLAPALNKTENSPNKVQ